jgi:hypothetical protein
MRYPMLAPKGFADFSSSEFHEYVKSLYVAPPKKAAPKEVSAKLNKKGTLTLKINREPKFLHMNEIEGLAAEVGWSHQNFWLAILKRKIEIKLPARKPKKR